MRTLSCMLGLVLVLGVISGCGSSGDCVSICEEAQDRGCTSITNCSESCAQAATLAERGGCQSQHDALESCAEDVDACEVDARCNAQEDAFASCVAAYCIANPATPECSGP